MDKIEIGEHIAEVVRACISDGEISETAYELLKGVASGNTDIDDAIMKVLQYYNIEGAKC